MTLGDAKYSFMSSPHGWGFDWTTFILFQEWEKHSFAIQIKGFYDFQKLLVDKSGASPNRKNAKIFRD